MNSRNIISDICFVSFVKNLPSVHHFIFEYSTPMSLLSNLLYSKQFQDVQGQNKIFELMNFYRLCLKCDCSKDCRVISV